MLLTQNIGPYRLKTQIGEGALTYVLRAEHAISREQVAVKVLHDRFRDRNAIKRHFYKTARSMMALEHPNIVKVREVNQSGANGLCTVVMDWVDHEAWTSLSVADKLRALDHIAQTLQVIHAQGVVHGNLKPSNIFCRKSVDGEIVVKLSDLGYRTPSDDTPPLQSALPFCSPERIRGEAVSERSDWYAFAVLLYEIVTGQYPFSSEQNSTLAGNIAYKDRTPILSLCPSLPDHIAHFIDRLLKLDPEERYKNEEELLQAWRKVYDDAFWATLKPIDDAPNPNQVTFRLLIKSAAMMLTITAVILIALRMLVATEIEEQNARGKQLAQLIVSQFADDLINESWVSIDTRVQHMMASKAFKHLLIVDSKFIIRGASAPNSVGQFFKQREWLDAKNLSMDSPVIRFTPVDAEQWPSQLPYAIANTFGIPDEVDVFAAVSMLNTTVGYAIFRMVSNDHQLAVVYARLYAFTAIILLIGLFVYFFMAGRMGVITLIQRGR